MKESFSSQNGLTYSLQKTHSEHCPSFLFEENSVKWIILRLFSVWVLICCWLQQSLKVIDKIRIKSEAYTSCERVEVHTQMDTIFQQSQWLNFTQACKNRSVGNVEFSEITSSSLFFFFSPWGCHLMNLSFCPLAIRINLFYCFRLQNSLPLFLCFPSSHFHWDNRSLMLSQSVKEFKN